MINLNILKPRKALNKAFLKVKAHRNEIELFKGNLINLLDRINESESEEFHKNLVADFLKRTYYGENHYINTKGRNDLVIHNTANASGTVGVIIEAKKPTNKSEMLRTDSINTKAFQELVLYYLRERITLKNLEIKYLIATNIYEWFIFDAYLFEKEFAENKSLVKQFTDFEEGRLSGKTTDFFYKQIAEPAIAAITHEVTFTWFDIRDYQKPLRNADKKDDNILIALYKLLSPEHLLKLPFANDSNSLDKSFYTELLHIIGLTETKEGGKKLIQRKKEGERNAGSFIESAIFQLDNLDKISRLEKPSQFGDTNQERLFNIALELSITWVNRILFLKLLEAQLIKYHKGDKAYAFLNLDKVQNFDDLNNLFFSVLARKTDERNDEVKKFFANVPYLNSSLFEPTEIEHACLFISQLKDGKLPLLSSTVIKNNNGQKRTGELEIIEYIFDFLNAYDFASEGGEEIQEDNKQLINASVLGLIFEKINGYKDGSFFTPGFITMYMCRETIRRAVVQKFNETKNWSCTDLAQLYDKIEDRKEANTIVNSLKICDPAVGSGHFLVSALNEIIAIKSDLRILVDRDGKRLKEYSVEVENDELIVTDDEGELFDYNPRSKESQRIQETLFHEKQTIIENCLFGVDINPNSVKICRLRLWIELLKNAYYRTTGELETLPNIDINIKCGNSLISRYALDADIKKALNANGWTVSSYRQAVSSYRNARSKEEKREMEELILKIKQQITYEIRRNDALKTRFDKLSHELYNRFTGNFLFEPEGEYNKKAKELAKKSKLEKERIEKEINILSEKMDEIRNNKLFKNPLEWRFEFPEVLNDDGDFIGFDVVIGNPPYIRQEAFSEFKLYLQQNYKTYTGTADLYVFFVEKGFEIVKKAGLFCYIMPNKWMQTGYGKPLRSLFLNNHLQSVIDFGDLQVFEEATTYPCILNASKENSNNTFKSSIVKTLQYINGFDKYIKSIELEMKTADLNTETWVISSIEDQSLLQKIKTTSISLFDYIEGFACYGIKTGLTEAFLIDQDKRDQLILEDANSINLIKPVLRGRDIKPWFSKSEGVYLICTFPNLKLDINSFPAIKKYLLTFGIARLEQSGANGSRKKTSNKWFETQDSIAYWQEFEKPKIMYQVLQVKPCFIYDDIGQYCNNSMWIIPRDDKFLVGLLNSKMGWWLISKYCTAIQNGYQLIWKYFGQIPIPKEAKNQKEIIDLVDIIISSKKQDPNSDTTALESEIDQLVYKLYGLTEEEIKIVKNR